MERNFWILKTKLEAQKAHAMNISRKLEKYKYKLPPRKRERLEEQLNHLIGRCIPRTAWRLNNSIQWDVYKKTERKDLPYFVK